MRVSDEELQRLIDYKASGEVRDCLLDLQEERGLLRTALPSLRFHDHNDVYCETCGLIARLEDALLLKRKH